jgi:hypothetical protein
MMKLLDAGLRSPNLPSRIAAMQGILYLLEAGVQEITKPLVPIATEFLLRNLGSISQYVYVALMKINGTITIFISLVYLF